MKQHIESDLVMLPSKESKFGLIYEGNKLHKFTNGENPNHLLDNLTVPQHLYIISNDEIKEGDYVYNKISKEIYKFNENQVEYEKKIIATTNKSLKIADFPELENTSYRSLPQIPQQFIEHYITEYNKGNILKTVLVGYEEYCPEVSNEEYVYIVNTLGIPFEDFKRTPNTKLITNPYNTINIKPAEVKIYSKEEVVTKIYDMINSGEAVYVDFNGEWHPPYELVINNKYIEENF